MNNLDKHFNNSSAATITLPKEENLKGIRASEWEKLKKDVKEISPNFNFIQPSAFLLLSGALSIITSMLTGTIKVYATNGTVSKSFIVAVIICGFLFVGASILIIATISQWRSKQKTAREIVNDMERIENGWEKGVVLPVPASNMQMHDGSQVEINPPFDILSGLWHLSITEPSGNKYTEIAQISADGSYSVFRNGEYSLAFRLAIRRFDALSGQIIFDKLRMSDSQSHSTEVLTVKTSKLLEGFGHGNPNHKLSYKRVN